AIECLAKDNLLIVSGEVKLTDFIRSGLDVVELARQVWYDIGYGDDREQLTVINHIRSQSPDIAEGNADESRTEAVGTDFGGAGDQGIMVGYATRETAEGVPLEWLLARNLCSRLRELQTSGTLP